MSEYLICAVAVSACVLVVWAAAADGRERPGPRSGPGGAGRERPGTPLLGGDPLSAFRLSGTDAEVDRVSIEGQPFAEALRCRVKVRPGRSYHVQLTAPTVAPVKEGDVILATFHARAVESDDESGEAVTEFVFEKTGQPWTKSKTFRAKAGGGWKRFDVPFKLAESYAAGGAHVCMRLGFRVQVIEIGGFELTGLGKTVPVAELPVTLPTYRGQEPDAAWRTAAAERIERHRKADLTIRVVDGRGRPVKGAEVRVKMVRHAYAFGSAVSSLYLQDGKETPDKERYRDEIVKLFNRVVIENNLKWWGWESRREDAIRTVDWLRGQGIEVRGHCLVWPSWRHTPKGLSDLKDEKALLAKRVLDHVADEASAMRGKLVEWDVINEPFSNHDLMDVLGPRAMVDWFRKAREADPDVKLFVNDYSILAGGGGSSAHRDHYEKTIRFLIDEGAPLDGVGVQCHFGGAVTAPEDLLKLLDRYAAFGKPIEVTEFDMKTGIEAFDAAYTRDFMTAVFSHPSTVGIIMWGFWDGRHWKKSAPIYRLDWSVKPSGRVWKDLVFDKWWTDETRTTDRRGEHAVRGFLGEYEVTATLRETTGSAKVSLGRGGARVDVVVR